MRVKNPNFVPPVLAVIAAKKPAVQAFLTAQAGENIEFDDIRASFPVAQRAALTDGVIHQICIDLGYKVEP